MEIGITAWIPEHLLPLPSCVVAGEVIAVNSSGVYLRFKESVLLLCDKSWGIVPIGISVERFPETLKFLRPENGTQVILSEKGIAFPNGNLKFQIVHAPQENRLAAKPLLSCIRQAAEGLAALQKDRGISMLVLPLILGHTMGETLQTNPYCVQAFHYLRKLSEALCNCAHLEIRNCVKKLLGLGLGLTPSADDVMMGMLYVFRKLLPSDSPAVHTFQESISELSITQTNSISAAYLNAIIHGAYFERMEQVFCSLCCDGNPDISPLIQIGSNSGSEMLLGMLIALNICGYTV